MVGKLNYNKWDNLELSDDSDIEVHPNVDKKSFIRWKQQDIHQKREERKIELDGLRREKDINLILMPMLDSVSGSLRDQVQSTFFLTCITMVDLRRDSVRRTQLLLSRGVKIVGGQSRQGQQRRPQWSHSRRHGAIAAASNQRGA